MRKISFLQLCLSVLILFSTFACEKNDVIPSKETTTQSDYVTSDGIPVFATQEEFDTELNKVKSMALEELKTYEDKKGYKSFGRISDEFYARIDPTQFKSQEDVMAFVKANSKYIQLYKASDGELYCETQEFQDGKRYLMNEQKMYIIGKKLYKVSEEKVEQQGMQKAPSIELETSINSAQNEAEFIQNYKIGSDYYRIHAYVSAEYWEHGRGMNLNIRNYSRSLAIWWLHKTFVGGGPIVMQTVDQYQNNRTQTIKILPGDASIMNPPTLYLAINAPNGTPIITNISINYAVRFKDVLCYMIVNKTF